MEKSKGIASTSSKRGPDLPFNLQLEITTTTKDKIHRTMVFKILDIRQ